MTTPALHPQEQLQQQEQQQQDTPPPQLQHHRHHHHELVQQSVPLLTAIPDNSSDLNSSGSSGPRVDTQPQLHQSALHPVPAPTPALALALAPAPAPPHHQPTTRKLTADPSATPQHSRLRRNKTQADDSTLRERDPNTSSPASAARRLLRKPGPGLLARLRLLDTRSKTRPSLDSTHSDDPRNVGRIPEHQLRQLDQLHKDHQIVVDRRGQPWRGPTPPQLESSLPGAADAGTTPTSATLTAAGASLQSSIMAAMMHEDSDLSSIISTSDRLALSESEDSEVPVDNQKYRLPDLGKSRGSSRNGFVLEDGSVADRDRPPTPPPKDTFDLSRSNTFNSTDDLTNTGPGLILQPIWALTGGIYIHTLKGVFLKSALTIDCHQTPSKPLRYQRAFHQSPLLQLQLERSTMRQTKSKSGSRRHQRFLKD